MSDPVAPAPEPFGAIGRGRETSVMGFVAAVAQAGPLEGWAFDVDLAGSVCYVRPDGRVSVYCTPDWLHEDGQICFSVIDDRGDLRGTDAISWPVGPNRTIASYRELVAVHLRQHATTEVPT